MITGTHLYTWLMGKRVGQDDFGNRYYRRRGGKTLWGRERRWVMYAGAIEASKVPPEWHAWLHHTSAEPLTDAAADDRPSAHLPNLTGTVHAYRPAGADRGTGAPRTGETGYQAWRPGT